MVPQWGGDSSRLLEINHEGWQPHNAIYQVRHTGTYKVVAEYVARKKEGEVKLYVENEEGMTKPK